MTFQNIVEHISWTAGFLRGTVILSAMSLFTLTGCGSDEFDASQFSQKIDLPIVFVHGALASGDTYATQFQRFSVNGYPEDHLFVFDWNTLNQGNALGLLDVFINSVLTKTGKSKLILVGHSAGSGLCYNYCNDGIRAAKIEKYIHLAGNPQSKPAGPNAQISTLNIWSEADLIVTGDSIPNALNIKFMELDHYQLATHESVFLALYEFVTGIKPMYSKILPSNEINIGGRVVGLGENNAVSATVVHLYALDPLTGFRKSVMADTSFSPDASGDWGPVRVNSNTYYELEVSKPGDAGFRIVHYYREPFIRNNPWVYLRVFPGPGSTLNLILGQLPKEDGQSVLAFFSANQAVISGRDQLEVDGYTLSTPNFTAPGQSTIALFLYDDTDCITTLQSKAIFSFLPFLKGADMYFSTKMPSSITLHFNGRTMKVPNWKSASEGVVIPVFD
ncbi:MAG: hypothetical protein IPM48_07645 [Saprospiraceae bacterium]|nr:hypothetical protein [Saprospiraceae bacterium]